MLNRRLKETKINSLPKGDIYEVSFGYNAKMGGYTTLMSDITKLTEIERKTYKEKYLIE